MSSFANTHFYNQKGFLPAVLAIALPVALQNVISSAAGLMDTLMLGQLGDIAISAANLGGQPFNVLNICGFGFASGASVLAAQYWGQRRMDLIRQLFAIAIRCILAVAAVTALICFFAPEAVMRLFTDDPELVAAAAEYLHLLAIGFVFYEFSNCYVMCLRAVENVELSLPLYISSFFVNVFFNYCLILGNFGFPALGVRGAAIGTVISRLFECVFATIYMMTREHSVRFTPLSLLREKATLWGDFVRSSLPVTGNELLWAVGLSTQTAIIGHMGSQIVAANSIASTVNNLLTVFSFGIASAAAVLLGRTIGERRLDDARRMANTLCLLGAAIGGVVGLLLFAARNGVVDLFAISDQTRTTALQFMVIMALMSPVDGMDCTLMAGVLRGGGDVRTNFLLDCGMLWIVGIPLGALGAFALHLSPVWVYFLLRSCQLVKVVLGGARLHSGRWIRVVTR